ncbi:MAG: tetratricopeptide repeat protein [Pseudomonadota bacterium]
MGFKSWYIIVFVLALLAAAILLHPTRARQGKMLAKSGELEEAIATFNEVLKENPDDHRTIKELAIALEAAGKTREAAKLFDKLIDLNPSDENYKEAKRFFVWNDDPRNAKKVSEKWYEFRTINKKDFKDDDGRDLLIDLYSYYLTDQQYKEAIDVLKKRRKLGKNPEDVNNIDGHLMQLFEKTGDLDTTIALLEKILKVDSHNREALDKYTSLAAISGKKTNIERILAKNIDDNPNNLEAWDELIDFQTKEKDYEGANTAFEKMLARFPANSELEEKYIDWFLGTEQHKGAITFLEQRLQEDPENIYYRDNLIQLYEWNDMTDKVLPYYLAEFRRNPRGFAKSKEMAWILYDAGNYSVVKDVLSNLIEIHPSDVDYALMLISIYDQEESPGRAIPIMEKLVEYNKDPKFMLDLGERYLWIGEIGKAEEIFNELLAMDYQDPSLYRYLGDINLAKNNHQEAIENYEKYAALAPDDYYAHYQLGEIYFDFDSKHKARQSFKKALALIDKAPPDLTVDIAKARMYALVGDIKTSDNLFAELEKNTPNNITVGNAYIDTLIDTNRLSLAEKVANDYRKNYSDNYGLRSNFIRIYLTQYNYPKAEQEALSLRQDYPEDPRVELSLAEVYYAQGDWVEAMPLLEKLQKIYPENLYIQRTYDDLFARYRPQVLVGFGFTKLGSEYYYGPYARYFHPINAKWFVEADYNFSRSTADIANFDPNYVAYTNIVNAGVKYKPYYTVTLGGGLSNQLVGTSYVPAPYVLAQWDDPRYGKFNLDFIFNKILDDPVEGLYFDGRTNRLRVAYEQLFIERLFFHTGYESNWYRVNSSKTGVDFGDEFGREDVAEAGVSYIILNKPQIRLGYDFSYSKLHIVNDYLALIPLIPESLRHDLILGIYYEWGKWVITDFYAFWGNDSKRDLDFTDFDLYGFNITNRVKINRRMEVAGHYEYSSESLAANVGRYHYFNVEFLYRF